MPAPIGARQPAGDSGLTVSDIVRILKQRLFLIMFIWIFIAGASVGVTFYLVKEFPLYTAKSLIQVESPGIKAPMELSNFNQMPTEIMDRFVNDQAMLVKDEEVLRESLQTEAIRETQWFQSQPNADEALEELKDKLSVSQIPRSSYLRVVFSTHRPEDSPVVVNTVVDKYLNRVENLSESELEAELIRANKEVETLQEQLTALRDSKQQFIESQLNTAGIASGINVAGQTWLALAEQVARLEAEALQYQSAYENLQAVDPSQIATTPQMMQLIQSDPQVSGLQNQLVALEQELGTLQQQGLGPQHRLVRLLNSRMDVVEKKLLQVQKEKEMALREHDINSAHTIYINAAQSLVRLRERLMEAESEQKDLDKNLAIYGNFEEQIAEATEQLRQVREHANKLRLVIEERGAVRVQRMSPATVPLQRSSPSFLINISAGTFLGLALGVGLAFLLEFADSSVKTPRDLVRHSHIPILGTVPDLDDEEVDIERIELAAYTSPRSMVAEAFRTFRTNLFLSAPIEQQRVLLITSPKPEEGKTSVASNLAISIGQSGRRVLLVDANFHRPALGELFPKSHKDGLSNILVGHRQLDDRIISHSEMPNLDVLTSGPIPPNPAELLSSPYMKKFLAQAKEQYDQVIIDGPPVLLLSDAMVMADIVDGVIMVCRAKFSQRGAVNRAREQLGRVNGHILGAVLNAAQISRGGYFREQMRNYYDYQPTEALTSQAVSRPLPADENDDGDEDVDVIDPVDERVDTGRADDVDLDIDLPADDEDFELKLDEEDLDSLIDDDDNDDRPSADDENRPRDGQ